MAQISVGIQLHENQIRMLPRYGSYGSRADGVFPAEHQWLKAELQNCMGGLLHLGEDGFRCAAGGLDSPEIDEGEIVEIPIQLRAVGL